MPAVYTFTCTKRIQHVALIEYHHICSNPRINLSTNVKQTYTRLILIGRSAAYRLDHIQADHALQFSSCIVKQLLRVERETLKDGAGLCAKQSSRG